MDVTILRKKQILATLSSNAKNSIYLFLFVFLWKRQLENESEKYLN